MNTLIINNITIKPGTRQIINLPMPKLYDWTPLSMPVHVLRGKEPGPTLCITAAIHGDEVNSIEIVRRLLKKIAIKKLKGSLIAIPVVNVYGFFNQERYLMDRRDLNRAFPGSQQGSLAARLTYLLSNEIIKQCTHLIDLHTGSLHRKNLPQVRANIDDAKTHRIAHAFNAPVILNSKLRDGSLRQYACELGIPTLLFEAGEALRFDDFSIKSGVNGIINVMHALGMIERHMKSRISPAIATTSYWIRAPHSGIFKPHKILGKRVVESDLLATIGNPTSTENYKLHSPIKGIIIGINNLPVVHEGAALFHIASFEKTRQVAEQIEYLQESHNESTDEFDFD